jgi:hypothetical protein
MATTASWWAAIVAGLSRAIRVVLARRWRPPGMERIELAGVGQRTTTEVGGDQVRELVAEVAGEQPVAAGLRRRRTTPITPGAPSARSGSPVVASSWTAIGALPAAVPQSPVRIARSNKPRVPAQGRRV